MASQSRRTRGLRHADPRDVTLQEALEALADPIRRQILRALDGEPDFTRACGTFDLPVAKATASHHFTVLRAAGVLEQVDRGPRRLNRLRRAEFDARFPGLLALVLAEDPADTAASSA
jgi:DNA-binding transcriptional ArsR family regulator